MVSSKKSSTFALGFEINTQSWGAIAQLVEQRTENPCVPGSIPGGTTNKKRLRQIEVFFLFASISILRRLNHFRFHRAIEYLS